MICRKVGEVVPGFHILGSWHTPSYLWNGPRPVMFDAGFSFFGDLYAEHARKVLEDRLPEFLFLTHVHFDHCGSASSLQDAFPGLRIAASKRAGEIIQRPNALELISKLNEEAYVTNTQEGVDNPAATGFQPFRVDTVLDDGDEISLGNGQVVQVLATPGHTRDFLSYYLPESKILIASEAVGCLTASGDIMVEFVADYDAYIDSMRRLKKLEIQTLCQGHFCVHVGNDAQDYIGRSIQATEKYREWVENLLEEENGDVRRVVERVKTTQWNPLPEPKQPAPAYLLNTQARVAHLASRKQQG